jgi:hypothetical protein
MTITVGTFQSVANGEPVSYMPFAEGCKSRIALVIVVPEPVLGRALWGGAISSDLSQFRLVGPLYPTLSVLFPLPRFGRECGL